MDRDIGLLSATVAPEALMIGPRPGPVSSGADLHAGMGATWRKMAADGVKFETAFRVERRTVRGDVSVELGYMRQRIIRPDGQMKIGYMHGLATMRRQADGSWRIISDASIPATEAEWNGVARVEGLKYDQ